jgi:hypothetical protein
LSPINLLLVDLVAIVILSILNKDYLQAFIQFLVYDHSWTIKTNLETLHELGNKLLVDMVT